MVAKCDKGLLLRMIWLLCMIWEITSVGAFHLMASHVTKYIIDTCYFVLFD